MLFGMKRAKAAKTGVHIRISTELFKAFKAECSRNGVTVTDAMGALMKATVDRTVSVRPVEVQMFGRQTRLDQTK